MLRGTQNTGLSRLLAHRKSAERTARPSVTVTVFAVCPNCGCSTATDFLKAPDRFHGRKHTYQLVRCSRCDLVWTKDPPPPSEMDFHYGVDYDKSVSGAGADPGRWRGRRDELLRYKTGGAVLDLGCSSGGFLSSLEGQSWKRYGIEMSSTVARMAEAKCGAQVFVGDILDAPFPANSFDAITCFHVFEHLYQPREILAKVAEWLKPDGIFYTMMPNIDSAGARLFQSYWYALELPRHLYHYSPASLKSLASSVGLQEVSLATHHEIFIEASVRYILDDVFRKVGATRMPLAQARQLSIPARALRKAFRLTILPLLNGIASLAGDGESIHAVFRKPAPASDVHTLGFQSSQCI